jgi:hypothetical protein
LDFLNYGTDFILFLNFPLVKLGFPLFLGFLIYGSIGFFGILKWIKWSKLVFGELIYYKGINVLAFLFYIPNIHFWTATLGKEPIIFWCISSVLYAVASQEYKTFSFIFGSILLFIIRPHVAFMLLFSAVIMFLFKKYYSIKKQIIYLLFSFLLLSIFLYMTLQLSNIRYFDWNRISYFNEYSILSLRDSGSYVPMLDYSYPYKFFSFYFRPLFYDSHNYSMFFASIENLIVLLLHLWALFFILFYKINFSESFKIVFLFSFIAGFIYIHRYANLGLFMRTKIMFEPFVLVGLVFIIKQGLNLVNLKKNE